MDKAEIWEVRVFVCAERAKSARQAGNRPQARVLSSLFPVSCWSVVLGLGHRWQETAREATCEPHKEIALRNNSEFSRPSMPMLVAPPTSGGGSLPHRPSSEQDYAAAGGRRHHYAAVSSSAGCSFGPSAPAMELRPRPSCNNNHRGGEERGCSPHQEVLKPQTGMTIRLTPELLGRLKEPGPKPKIELVLKRAEEGTGTLSVTPLSAVSTMDQ